MDDGASQTNIREGVQQLSTTQGEAKPAKWQSKLEEFLSQIPTAAKWSQDSKLFYPKPLSISSLSEPGGNLESRRRRLLQHMDDYFVKSMSEEDKTTRAASELLFLASCAVLANRHIPECSLQDVETLVRQWYYQPSLKSHSIWDRFNGIKWIGQVCTSLFPFWGRRCHDIFILYGIKATQYSQFRASQIHTLPLATRMLQHSAFHTGTNEPSKHAPFSLPCLVYQLIGPYCTLSLETICTILEYTNEVANDVLDTYQEWYTPETNLEEGENYALQDVDRISASWKSMDRILNPPIDVPAADFTFPVVTGPTFAL